MFQDGIYSTVRAYIFAMPGGQVINYHFMLRRRDRHWIVMSAKLHDPVTGEHVGFFIPGPEEEVEAYHIGRAIQQTLGVEPFLGEADDAKWFGVR